MSQSDLVGAAGAAGGFAFYSYGTRIIINYPWTNFRWSFYEGPLTPGRGGPEPDLADFLDQGNISFNERMHGVAPNPIRGVKGAS